MNTNWLDERIRLDEVPEGARAKATARRESPEGARAAQAIEQDDAAILRRLPPRLVAERIGSRRAERAPRRPWLRDTTWIPLVVAACALVLAFVVDPGTPQAPTAPSIVLATPAEDSVDARDSTVHRSVDPTVVADVVPTVDDGIRIRGDRGFSLLAVAPDGSVEATGDTIPGGSILRIVAPALGHAAVYSFDGTGTLQRHWPLEGDSSRALPAGALPRDWETDPSAGWERFVLVSSPKTFDLRRLEAHLRGAAASRDPGHRAIRLPDGMVAGSILVERKGP